MSSETANPGKVSYADTTDLEWYARYGSPYSSSDGYLVPWCKNCGEPMVDPCSPGTSEPYFDTDEGEADPECRPGERHEPVYIWTPYSTIEDTEPVQLELYNLHRAISGLDPVDPFGGHIDEADDWIAEQDALAQSK